MHWPLWTAHAQSGSLGLIAEWGMLFNIYHYSLSLVYTIDLFLVSFTHHEAACIED